MQSTDTISFTHPPEPGRVSIVVVCYQSRPDLEALVPTIDAQTYDDIELICVLNDGDDVTKDYLADRDATVLDPGENLWYSAGNNYGVEHATGEYIFVLSPDTELRETAVEELVAANNRNPASVIIPKVLKKDETGRTDMIDSVGMQFRRGGWAEKIGEGDASSEWTDELKVAAFDGPAVFLPREIIEEVGLFDERFEFTGETVDLALRLFRNNTSIIMTPNAYVWHEGQTSTTADERNELYYYYGTRNNAYYFAKHYSRLTLPVYLLNQARVRGQQLFTLLRNGEYDHAKALLKGVKEGIELTWTALRERDQGLPTLSLLGTYPRPNPRGYRQGGTFGERDVPVPDDLD